MTKRRGQNDINDQGCIHRLACLLSRAISSFASFDFPTCTITVPTGMNIRKQVVGLCFDDSGTHGFRPNLTGVPWLKFDVPGSTFTSAAAINASGQIIGQWRDIQDVNHACVRATDGRFTSFDPAAPCVQSKLNTVAHGIKEIEFVHGFIMTTAGFRTLDFPSARHSATAVHQRPSRYHWDLRPTQRWVPCMPSCRRTASSEPSISQGVPKTKL